MTRFLALFVSVVAAGCAGKVDADSTPDTGTDTRDVGTTIDAESGVDSDVPESDVDADAAPTFDAPPCPPIVGTAPFGVHLSGSGPITDAGFGGTPSGSVNAAVDVYFPKGRVPGAEVVLAVSNFGGGSSVSYGTLDSTLSARGLRGADRYCGDGFSGDLVGPSDGIVGVAFNNTSAPSDALTFVSGPVKMCPTGAVPGQKVDPPPSVVTPFDPLVIRGARPFERDSFASITALTSSGALALNVSEAEPGVRVGLAMYASPTFSLFTQTTLDLTGVRDVLGGPLGLSVVRTVVPTSTESDLEFATMPPSTAYVGGPVSVASGVLQVGNTSVPTPTAAASAFDVPAGKTKAKFRHRLSCTGYSYFTAVVVTPSGTTASLAPKCSPSMSEDTVALPSGTNMLFVRSPDRNPPCTYPAFFGPSAYDLDQISFE